MRKIKVCHVVSALEAGGVETLIYNYCSKLDLSKFEVHILYQRQASKKNQEEFEKLGFFLKEIPEKMKHPLKNYFETKKYLKDNQIDVVHAHMTLANFIPLLAAKKIGIKNRVSHSHNSDVRDKATFNRIFEYILKILTMKYATKLVACGNDAGKYLYLNKDFIVLNNALNLEKFKYNEEKRQKIRMQYNISQDSILIGNIGRFTEQKNQDFLISILKELVNKNSKYKLMIIGDGYLEFKLKQKVEELKITKNVIFTGIVDNTDCFYSAFDVFVLPSLWEGLPVSGLEAQASGLKCLFSENIDKDVIILKEKVKVLDLQTSTWLNELENLDDDIYNRNIDIKEFENRNLNIEKEVKKLENIYNN